MSQQPTVATPGSAMALTPADVWRVIRKRFWLIVACFVVFGLGGVGAVIGWHFWFPYYTASGAIEVEPGQGQAIDLTRGYQDAVDVRLFPQYVESQVRAIRDTRVLTAALEALKDQQTMYPGSTPLAAYELSKDLDVVHLVNTQHILVSLTGRDPTEVRDIVREVLRQYIDQLDVSRKEADAARQKELRDERDDLSRQLVELGRKLAAFREESAVIVADERGGEQLAALNALVRQLTIAQVELAAARADWTLFQELRGQAEETKDLSAVLMSFPAVMDTMRRDPTIVSLTQMSARFGQELEGLEQRLGPEHESVRRLKVSAQANANDLEIQRSEVINQLVQQQAAVLKSAYDSARTAEAELQTRVAEARAAALSAAKLTADYRARESEYVRVQTLLNTVMDGLARMRISATLARANIRIAGQPEVPLEPTQPKVVLYSVAAVLFSLLVGVGLSLLIELADTRLRTPAQVVRHVGLPMLTRVPDLTEDERLSLDVNLALVSHTAPHSLVAESFRQLRTHLLFSSDKPIRSLLITSPGPGDGKTTVAANLAITMARTGERVLLVEANFRRPALPRVFDLPDAVGLSNVLVGLNSISEAVQATAVENLDVLVGGPPPPSPAGLVGCETMRQLVAEEVEAYDRVIVDGAPMLVVADNHLVTPMLDGVILVFHAGENTRGVAQRAVQQIVTLHGRLFGAVLNRVRATKGGYFRESFQAYYDYAGAPPNGRAAVAVTPSGQPDRDVNGAGGADTT